MTISLDLVIQIEQVGDSLLKGKMGDGQTPWLFSTGCAERINFAAHFQIKKPRKSSQSCLLHASGLLDCGG